MLPSMMHEHALIQTVRLWLWLDVWGWCPAGRWSPAPVSTTFPPGFPCFWLHVSSHPLSPHSLSLLRKGISMRFPPPCITLDMRSLSRRAVFCITAHTILLCEPKTLNFFCHKSSSMFLQCRKEYTGFRPAIVLERLVKCTSNRLHFAQLATATHIHFFSQMQPTSDFFIAIWTTQFRSFHPAKSLICATSICGTNSDMNMFAFKASAV